MDNCGTMEVAALSRPFHLGMLYDCRNDSLIPGVSLWNSKEGMEPLPERLHSFKDVKITASESTEDTFFALNVEASLKTSFLCGLVQANGSAKYLNDSKTSRNQARVTLKYKVTTKFQELSINHLGTDKMKYQYVFDNGLATHVVAGILYGVQAFFVFDREVSEMEDRQEVEENLKVVINKILSGSLKMKDEDKAMVDKFSCRFYGDFLPEKTPTTFQDGVEVYQSLPKLLGVNGEKAIPVRVWMLPLTILDSSAAKSVCEISAELVQEVQSVFEEFTELDMRCNDALRTTTAQQFPHITKKLQHFKKHCSEFKLVFQQSLAKTLPSIRRGREVEAKFAEVLKKRHSSPFITNDLNYWMDCTEKEIYLLTNQNIKFLTVGPTNQNQGSTIYHYKDTSAVSENFEPPSEPEIVAADDINHNSVLLKISSPSCGADNITSYSVEFCIIGEDGWQQKTEPKAEEVTVSGLRPNTEYQFRCRAIVSEAIGPAGLLNGPIKTLPCSPPGKPHVEPTSCTVSVSWEKPTEIGQDVQISSYIVEYAEMDPEKKEQDLQWKKIISRLEKGIISGLQSETRYAVRVRCDCGIAGRSKVSGTVHVCTKKHEFTRLVKDQFRAIAQKVFRWARLGQA